MDSERLQQGSSELGITLTDAQIAQFSDFEERLYAHNEVKNLTRVPREECVERHFLDSLIVANLIPQGSRVLDLGTGPGFPAWPLACARPDLSVVAMDSNGKMLDFLRANTLPNLDIVQARAEEIARRESFDVVTGRAVAPLPVQLEISAAWARIGGAVIAMRSLAEREQIESWDPDELGLKLSEVHEIAVPGTEIVRCLPVYAKVARTPGRYPRRWGDIKKKPLGS